MEEVTNRKWKHFCAYLFSGKPHPVKFPFITLRAASWALWNANCSSTRILLYRQLIAHYPMLSHGSLTNFPASKILCSLFCRVHRLGCNRLRYPAYTWLKWRWPQSWPFYQWETELRTRIYKMCHVITLYPWAYLFFLRSLFCFWCFLSWNFKHSNGDSREKKTIQKHKLTCVQ